MTRTTNRRHSTALAIGWILTLLAVSSCRVRKRRPSRPVVVVQSGEAATLDWHMHCDKNAHEPDRQIFDTLLRRNLKTLQLEGNLAESWRLLNDTTWQFKLRRNVKFHNGEPFDAAAVKFSVERMLNPQAGGARPHEHRHHRPGRGRRSIHGERHQDALPAAPGPHEPGPLRNGGHRAAEVLAQVGDAGFAVKPVGTGPYKFVEWVKDERLVLEANKDYHRGAPAIDRLVFRPIPELTTRGRAPHRPGGPRQRRAARSGRQGQGERGRPHRGLHPGRLRHHDEDHQLPDAGTVAGRARPEGHEPRHRHADDP